MPDIYRYSGVLKNKLEFQVHMLQCVNVIVNLCVNLTRLQHNVIESNTRLDVVVVQLLSRVRRFVTPWTTACPASLSFTISRSLLKLMSIQSVMPSNHLILCCPLLLLPSILSRMSLFQRVSSSHQVPKVLEFWLQHQSFQWIFRVDWLVNWYLS